MVWNFLVGRAPVYTCQADVDDGGPDRGEDCNNTLVERIIDSLDLGHHTHSFVVQCCFECSYHANACDV